MKFMNNSFAKLDKKMNSSDCQKEILFMNTFGEKKLSTNSGRI